MCVTVLYYRRSEWRRERKYGMGMGWLDLIAKEAHSSADLLPIVHCSIIHFNIHLGRGTGDGNDGLLHPADR